MATSLWLRAQITLLRRWKTVVVCTNLPTFSMLKLLIVGEDDSNTHRDIDPAQQVVHASSQLSESAVMANPWGDNL